MLEKKCNNFRIRVIAKNKRDKVTIVTTRMKDVKHDGKKERGNYKNQYIITKFSYVITSIREMDYTAIYLFVKANFNKQTLDMIEYPAIAAIKEAYDNFSLNEANTSSNKK